MKTISADYNAMTEAGHVCLTTRGSQEEMQRFGIQPGDWVWLTDSELIVGARVSTDPYYGVVGVADWDTLVHLDVDDDRDPMRIQAELHELLEKSARSKEEELRVFQLLTLFEEFSVPAARSSFRPGYFSFRRAGSLLLPGKPELALLEIDDARRLDPGRSNDDRLFLDVLRHVDLPRATREAEALAARPNAPADVLAECVNVLANSRRQSARRPIRAGRSSHPRMGRSIRTGARARAGPRFHARAASLQQGVDSPAPWRRHRRQPCHRAGACH